MPHTRRRRATQYQTANFLEGLIEQFGDVPLFLEGTLPSLTGLAHISVRDVFRVGGQTHVLHPAARGAFFVLVNRRSKNPRFLRHTPLHEQPLYLLQERNGPYFLASCSIEGGRLMVHIDPRVAALMQSAPRYADAEVLGQVVAIARTVLPPI
jgi:hypothetical protein